jgi:exoribonuclease R
MIGTILFSSKIRYGKNKRNIPYYIFIPDNIEDGIDDKYIVASKLGNTTRVDHYAKIEIIDTKCNPSRGAIQMIFGPVNDNEACVKFTLYKYNILPRKPINIIETNEIQQRLDLTNEECYSIDPEGTIDIDDAFHYKINNGILELGIHITDISDIDISEDNFDTLITNCSTFYLNGFNSMRNLSLFDENLCNDKGSLLANKDRKCLSLMITFGKSIEYTFRKTIINNKHAICYENADKLMKKNKDFGTFITKLEKFWGEIPDSHILIEKMMIFYNNKIAETLNSQNIDFPIRVHQGINKDIFERYKQLNSIDNIRKNDILKKICYHSAEYVNSKEYENPFHYGLDISLYTHASSPLRRVTDYLIQQIFTHNNKYDINRICEVLNDKMKKIKKAYRNITKLRLIDDMKSSNERIYDAVVTDFDSSRIIVYIHDLDIIHPINIFSRLNDVINICLTSTSIIISHKSTDNKIEINLLQNVKINIMITPYEHRMNKKIRLYLIDPNLVSLID